MTHTYDPPARAMPLLVGAVGGMVAGAVSLAVLGLLCAARGAGPWVPMNAVGAWLVRWLQVSDASAATGLYADATVGGAVVVLLLGGLVGAVCGAVLDRGPVDHPAAMAVLLSLAVLVLTRWLIAPALDPMLVRDLPGLQMSVAAGGDSLRAALLQSLPHVVASVIFGLVLGGWLHAARASRRPRADARGHA